MPARRWPRRRRPPRLLRPGEALPLQVEDHGGSDTGCSQLATRARGLAVWGRVCAGYGETFRRPPGHTRCRLPGSRWTGGRADGPGVVRRGLRCPYSCQLGPPNCAAGRPGGYGRVGQMLRRTAVRSLEFIWGLDGSLCRPHCAPGSARGTSFAGRLPPHGAAGGQLVPPCRLFCPGRLVGGAWEPQVPRCGS